MTDADQTQTAEATVAQDAPAPASAPEAPAAQEAPPAPPETAADTSQEPAEVARAEFDNSVPDEAPSVPDEAPAGFNLNAHRGVPAGPDHTRNSEHSAYRKA